MANYEEDSEKGYEDHRFEKEVDGNVQEMVMWCTRNSRHTDVR